MSFLKRFYEGKKAGSKRLNPGDRTNPPEYKVDSPDDDESGIKKQLQKLLKAEGVEAQMTVELMDGGGDPAELYVKLKFKGKTKGWIEGFFDSFMDDFIKELSDSWEIIGKPKITNDTLECNFEQEVKN